MANRGYAPICFFGIKFLFSETGFDQLDQRVNSLLFISAVGNDLDEGAAYNAQGQNAQQALGVYTAFFLFNPDGRLEFVGLQDEEGSGTGVKTYVILNGYFFYVHIRYSPYSFNGWCLSLEYMLHYSIHPKTVNGHLAPFGALLEFFYLFSNYKAFFQFSLLIFTTKFSTI